MKSKLFLRAVATVTLLALPTAAFCDDWAVGQSSTDLNQKIAVQTNDGKILKGALKTWKDDGITLSLKGQSNTVARKDVSVVTTGTERRRRALIGFAAGFGLGLAIGAGAGNPKNPARRGAILGIVLGGAGAGMAALTGEKVILFRK